MTLNEILSQVVEVYGCDGVLEDYIESPKEEFGDGLASFIVREASSVYDPDVSDEENIQAIIEALERASNQLLAVSNHLRQILEEPNE